MANTVNALIDQQFTGDINIFPGYGASSLSAILKMLSEEEMVALIRRASAPWPGAGDSGDHRIGRTLDRIPRD